MLRSTGKQGFQMEFENGWTVSVQWGYGNYGTNYGDDERRQNRDTVTAEAARWKGGIDTIKELGVAGEDVRAWQTADQIAAFIAETASL